MSIGKRFVNLLKSNLNSIIDSTSSWDSPFGGKGAPIEDLSDEELELEMTRRKERREAAERDRPLFVWAMNGNPLGCT